MTTHDALVVGLSREGEKAEGGGRQSEDRVEDEIELYECPRGHQLPPAGKHVAQARCDAD